MTRGTNLYMSAYFSVKACLADSWCVKTSPHQTMVIPKVISSCDPGSTTVPADPLPVQHPLRCRPGRCSLSCWAKTNRCSGEGRMPDRGSHSETAKETMQSDCSDFACGSWFKISRACKKAWLVRLVEQTCVWQHKNQVHQPVEPSGRLNQEW